LRIESHAVQVGAPAGANPDKGCVILIGMGLARLAEYHNEVLHPQSPAEARRMQVLAGHLRQALNTAGLSRQQFADRTGLAIELIVAVENGYGRPQTARRLLRLARTELDDR
jgi:hypothetical protein